MLPSLRILVLYTTVDQQRGKDGRRIRKYQRVSDYQKQKGALSKAPNLSGPPTQFIPEHKKPAHFLKCGKMNPSQGIKPHCIVGGLVVSVLATGPKVRGFDPDRGRWIFKGDKNPEHHFLRRGSKAVGPMS
jgi:hypothetical protein